MDSVTQGLIATQVILFLVLLAGTLVGWWLQRRLQSRVNRPEDVHRGSLGDALGFVGGAFGIILGLLLVFAVQHFTDAQEAARHESVSATGLYQATGPFPQAERAAIRRDLICGMRSIVTDDWVAAGEQQVAGSPITAAWLGRVQAKAETLDQGTDAAASFHYFVAENILSLDKDRQLRLLLALPNIPAVIWAVIYTCAFIFVALLMLQLGALRRLAVISIVATWLVLAVSLWSLRTLDHPFTGADGSVEPVAITTALAQLELQFPNEDWSPCPAQVPATK